MGMMVAKMGHDTPASSRLWRHDTNESTSNTNSGTTKSPPATTFFTTQSTPVVSVSHLDVCASGWPVTPMQK